MTVFLKIETEPTLSLREANELVRRSKEKGITPAELTADFIRQGLKMDDPKKSDSKGGGQ